VGESIAQSNLARRFAFIFRIAWLWLLYALVASAVMHAYMYKWKFRTDDPNFSLESLVHFSASHPYAERLLSPLLIRAASDWLPTELTQRFAQYLTQTSRLLMYRQAGDVWDLEKSLHYHIAYAYMFLCLIGLLLVGRRLTRIACSTGALFSDLAPVVALIFLPLTFHLGGFIYDFAELALIGYATLALIERRYLAFHLIYLVAILNKESNVLLIVYFALLAFPELNRRRRIAHALVLATTGLLLTLTILHVTRAAPGAPGILNFAENVAFWCSPRSYFKVIEGYSPLVPFPQGLHCVNLFILVAIVLLAHRRAPIRQRRLFFAMLAIGAPLLLTFGWQDEIRAMALCLIPLYLLACHALKYVYDNVELHQRAASEHSLNEGR